MLRGGSSASAKERRGVLDAGVVLVRLDRRHRSHEQVRDLFDRSLRGEIDLAISAVNLAEVFQHAHRYSTETGLDPAALLTSLRVSVRSPGIDAARRAAALCTMADASLADRFAVATAHLARARLYTTDGSLAQAARKEGIRVTRL